MKSVSVITIGNELLLGKVINTNATFLAKTMSEYGFDVRSLLSIGDYEDVIIQTLKRESEESDLVVVSGGLGSTDDDVTRESIAKFLDRKLILEDKILDKIKTIFKRRNIEMPDSNKKQAMVIEGAVVLENKEGLAPGTIIEINEKCHILLLPGVPKEVKSIICSMEAEKYMRELSGNGQSKMTFKVFKTLGISESKIDELIHDVALMNKEVEFGSYPHESDIQIHLVGKGKNKEHCQTVYKELILQIRAILKDYIYAEDDENIESIVSKELTENGKSIYIAEAHTCGLISHSITKTPGASRYFMGGTVIYSPVCLKEIGVTIEEVKTHGASSEYFVKKVAEHMKKEKCVDICLCASGAAGPDVVGNEPVGASYIAIATDRGTFVNYFVLPGNREMVQKRCSVLALQMIRLYLEGKNTDILSL